MEVHQRLQPISLWRVQYCCGNGICTKKSCRQLDRTTEGFFMERMESMNWIWTTFQRMPTVHIALNPFNFVAFLSRCLLFRYIQYTPVSPTLAAPMGSCCHHPVHYTHAVA